MKVLMLLLRTDFDPSEAAVSWRILGDAGHAIAFATPDGSVAYRDLVENGASRPMPDEYSG
jgi:putative intracellular protease/amidase